MFHPTFFVVVWFGFASECNFFANLHHFVSWNSVVLVREWGWFCTEVHFFYILPASTVVCPLMYS